MGTSPQAGLGLKAHGNSVSQALSPEPLGKARCPGNWAERCRHRSAEPIQLRRNSAAGKYPYRCLFQTPRSSSPFLAGQEVLNAGEFKDLDPKGRQRPCLQDWGKDSATCKRYAPSFEHLVHVSCNIYKFLSRLLLIPILQMINLKLKEAKSVASCQSDH